MAKTILELWKDKFSGNNDGANVTASNFYSSDFANSSEADSFDYNQVRNLQNVGDSTFSSGSTYSDSSLNSLEEQVVQTGSDLYKDQENDLFMYKRSGLIARYLAIKTGIEVAPDNPDTADVNEEIVALGNIFSGIDNLLAEQIQHISDMQKNYDDFNSD